MTETGARCCQAVSRCANGKLCQKLPFKSQPANDWLWSDAAGRSWRDLPFKACPLNANLVIEDRPQPRVFVGPASKGLDEARGIVSLISVVMTLASGFVEVGSGLA